MTTMVEVPLGLVVLGSTYIGITIAITLLISLLTSPTVVIMRRKSAYFDDWNSALKAPWLFWYIGGLWFRVTELLGNYVLPAPQRVSEMAFAYCKSQAVITFTQLGIPDALQHGPKTSQQLATELKLHQPYLERLLRLSERMGLVDIEEPKAVTAAATEASAAPAAASAAAAGAAKGDADNNSGSSTDGSSKGNSGRSNGSSDGGPLRGRLSWSSGRKTRTSWSSRVDIKEGQLYHLTQLSAVLCESHVNSVKHMVLLFGEHYAAFGQLAQGVRTGQTPYKLYSGGLSHWEHMQKEPELYDAFNKAMTNFNNLCPIEAVFLEYSFQPFSRLIDVGGGLGAFTAAALAAAPQLKGCVFDLPHVIKQAQEVWGDKHSTLMPRISFAAGSFFEQEQIPAATSNSDVFAMRQILHDWSDADSVRILKQVRAAVGEFTGAKLLIVESCLCSRHMTTTHTPRLCGDIHMLVQYGDAKERTEQQFGALLQEAGFRLSRVIPTKSLFFVLEAVPV